LLFELRHKLSRRDEWSCVIPFNEGQAINNLLFWFNFLAHSAAHAVNSRERHLRIAE